MNINIRDKCKCISLFFSWLFHLWFPLKFLFTYSLSLMQQKKTWNNEYLLELIKRRSKVQKYISHVNVLWTLTEEKIFQKLQGNYSFIMTCLQIYCEQSSLKTFLQVHSISKEVSYLPWQNKSPNLKTTCHIKQTFFLWIRHLENLLFTNHSRSLSAVLVVQLVIRYENCNC